MDFLTQLGKIINTGQSRSVVLHGNIHDLFQDGKSWVPLVDLLKTKCRVDRTENQKGITQVIYQTNRPIEIIDVSNNSEIEQLWERHYNDGKKLRSRLDETLNNPTYAMELLRQITELVRLKKAKNNLLIIIESAEMLFPQTPISQMSIQDRKRLSIMQDWFKNPDFVNGHDTVVLISESLGGIHERISRLPQVLSVDIPLPDTLTRYQFILSHPASEAYKAADPTPHVVGDPSTGSRHTCTLADTLSEQTSGLSIHAVNQLLRSGDYSLENVTNKVGEYMISQLGEGVVEFKRPTHTLNDVIGFSRVKKFMQDELIPGFMRDGKDCIAGALVGGPIGSGKTFICEAVASELGVPVIVLKNIRSKWYGETDETFERLRRLVETFHKIVIFVDEADTQFGGVDSEQDVERRLTGKIQAMMSDPSLRGRVVWFLMTARVHKLSADIRRPGRMDLIIPILDPEDDEDREEFINWTFGEEIVKQDTHSKLKLCTEGISSGSYAMIRSMVRTKGCGTLEEVLRVVEDIADPDIKDTRRYQTLQAMMNCTRKSLVVPKITLYESCRTVWREELAKLEAKGIK